jgi:hypothetical protein
MESIMGKYPYTLRNLINEPAQAKPVLPGSQSAPKNAQWYPQPDKGPLRSPRQALREHFRINGRSTSKSGGYCLEMAARPSRNTNFCTFPVAVFGYSLTK